MLASLPARRLAWLDARGRERWRDRFARHFARRFGRRLSLLLAPGQPVRRNAVGLAARVQAARDPPRSHEVAVPLALDDHLLAHREPSLLARRLLALPALPPPHRHDHQR